ncbi:LLM class F420-dependent oxidoreductase, partial [Schumannella luteola]
MSWSERIGEVGVWRGTADVDAALAAEIEGLGFGAIWLGGSPPSDLRAAEALLDATERIV